MRVKKLQYPIVIDRYKMPELDDTGTDISKDMCYGFGMISPRPIYSNELIERYKTEYQRGGGKGGFNRGSGVHKAFSNHCGSDEKAIYNKSNFYKRIS